MELTNEQKNRIKEIIEEEGYEVVGMDNFDGNVFIGIIPKNYKQISEKLSNKINETLGLNPTINL